MIRMKKNNKYIIFSLLGVVLVLWQLLSNGYILTMDMVWGPHINLHATIGSLVNSMPMGYFFGFLTFVLNGWIAQKIYLIIIFFLLFYLPLHFFKKIFKLENTGGGEYIASLVFAINPFVYERFLAGHWALILGYALLVPTIAYLVDYCREWNNKNLFKLFAIIVILGVVSIHILMIALIIVFISILCNLIYQKGNLVFFKQSILLGVFVLIASSYWIVPAIFGTATPLATFSPEHWEVFKTAGSGYLGTLTNVLSLHGFWAEHEPWIERFVLPKSGGWVFITALISFFLLITTGIYAGLKEKQSRRIAFFMICLMFFAVIFSCGVGEGIFRNFNIWMFEHIYFWKGFRDSEKWSAVVALLYSLFAGLGARTILLYFQNIKYKRVAFYVLVAVPIFYTPMMLFGVVGQLKTVEYPKSWQVVNDVLKEDKNCRMLFLPWHQYYYLKFNDGILTANLSQNYFDCDVVFGLNMELGSINSQGGNGEEYDEIEKVVEDNVANPDATIEFLRQKGIKYIVFTDDLINDDIFSYPFLGSKNIQEVIHTTIIDKNSIIVYSI